ncbi:MAG: Zn-ribbon domain-containing OB-fold protein, partial [Actinomycetota bacterium]
ASGMSEAPPGGPVAESLPVIETPPYSTAGHSLSDAEFRSAVGAVDFRLDPAYSWDAGVAISRFLDGLKAGRILARECRSCGRVLVPPRMFCERCFRPTDAWVEVPDTGTVETFSICHVRWDMQPLDPPEIPAVIRIHNTSEGGLLHMVAGIEPAAVSIGMTVRAVWGPEGERVGSILDIAHFEPVERS